jgi:hypothetical protein
MEGGCQVWRRQFSQGKAPVFGQMSDWPMHDVGIDDCRGNARRTEMRFFGLNGRSRVHHPKRRFATMIQQCLISLPRQCRFKNTASFVSRTDSCVLLIRQEYSIHDTLRLPVFPRTSARLIIQSICSTSRRSSAASSWRGLSWWTTNAPQILHRFDILPFLIPERVLYNFWDRLSQPCSHFLNYESTRCVSFFITLRALVPGLPPL